MNVLDAPDILRDAGLDIDVLPGFAERGRGPGLNGGKGIVVHDDVIPEGVSDAARHRVIRNGHSALRGPLAFASLAKRGRWTLVAAGRANHGGRGEWQGIEDLNGEMLGVECAWYPGESYPAAQIDSLVRGCAALAAGLGFSERMVCHHRECARPLGRKADMHWRGPLREQVGLHMLAAAGVQSAAVPWTPARFTVTHQHQEDAVQMLELVTPPLDDQGRGWLPLDGLDGRPLVPWGSLISAIPQGSHPGRDAAYWPTAEVGMQQEGPHTLLTIQGGAPATQAVLYLHVTEAA